MKFSVFISSWISFPVGDTVRGLTGKHSGCRVSSLVRTGHWEEGVSVNAVPGACLCCVLQATEIKGTYSYLGSS